MKIFVKIHNQMLEWLNGWFVCSFIRYKHIYIEMKNMANKHIRNVYFPVYFLFLWIFIKKHEMRTKKIIIKPSQLKSLHDVQICMMMITLVCMILYMNKYIVSPWNMKNFCLKYYGNVKKKKRNQKTPRAIKCICRNRKYEYIPTY